MSRLIISKQVLRVALIALTYHLFLKSTKYLKSNQTPEDDDQFYFFKMLGASGLFGIGIGLAIKIINKYLY